MGLEFEKKPEPKRIAFDCPEDMREHVAKVFRGEYDVPLENVKTVLDLGANYGSFSMWAAHRWPSCTIEAYEPVPKVFESLTRNLESLGERVRCHCLAVREFNRSEIGTIFREELITMGSCNSGESSFFIDGSEHVSVLRTPASALDPADFVKIDTEGCEPEIVRGYEHWDTVRGVAYEWHRPGDRWMLGAFFHERGFRLMHETIVAAIPERNVAWGEVGVAKWMRGG